MPARIFLRTLRRAADAPFRGFSAVIPALAILLATAIVPAMAQTLPAGGTPAHLHDAAPAGPVPAAAAVPPASAPAVAPAAAPVAPADPAPAQPAGAAAPLPSGTPSLPATLLPHDLSPWGMFMAADKVVKAVMIGLALASFVTWTIWLAKSLELAFARRTVARTLAALRQEPSLADAAHELPEGRGAPQQLVRVALGEWHASAGLPSEGIKERVSIALGRIEAGAGRRMTAGTGILATIGAIGPFVGLFGTVWGIMNSFIGISKAQTTNLAVVAPGIAEALLATAIGLVAAIPAVVIYNVFARAISAYKASLTDTSAEVLRHLSRDLDRAAQGDESALPLRAAAE